MIWSRIHWQGTRLSFADGQSGIQLTLCYWVCCKTGYWSCWESGNRLPQKAVCGYFGSTLGLYRPKEIWPRLCKKTNKPQFGVPIYFTWRCEFCYAFTFVKISAFHYMTPVCFQLGILLNTMKYYWIFCGHGLRAICGHGVPVYLMEEIQLPLVQDSVRSL